MTWRPSLLLRYIHGFSVFLLGREGWQNDKYWWEEPEAFCSGQSQASMGLVTGFQWQQPPHPAAELEMTSPQPGPLDWRIDDMCESWIPTYLKEVGVGHRFPMLRSYPPLFHFQLSLEASATIGLGVLQTCTTGPKNCKEYLTVCPDDQYKVRWYLRDHGTTSAWDPSIFLQCWSWYMLY